MEKNRKGHTPKDKKKFRSPVGGKRTQKTPAMPKFRFNLKNPEKQAQRGKVRPGKSSSKLRFRLGGDSSDPLNLNSLINRDPSEVTPQCSPYVERVKDVSPHVFVRPQDVTDPLNLKCDLYQDMKGIVVVTPTRKKRKHKRNNSGCNDEEMENKPKGDSSENRKKKKKVHYKKEPKRKERKEGKDDRKMKKRKVEEERQEGKKEDSARKEETEDKEQTFVSEASKDLEKQLKDKEGKKKDCVEGKKTKTDLDTNMKTAIDEVDAKQEQRIYPKPSQKSAETNPRPKNKKAFIYGNYNRYYGYRNPNIPDDPRLKLLKAEWFKDKRVLDIGCNIGNVTLQVAQEYGPKHILGIDIDSSLIRAANKYLQCAVQEHKSQMSSSHFPMSFVVCRGPIVPSGFSAQGNDAYPYNVEFKEENYVLHNDEALARQKPTYDVILCLSLTKWIHLNWGDEGLKRTFKRMFLTLQPGGRLLLEAQPFSSYSRRKNLSEKIRRNYDAIRFTPNMFVDFLMSEEVGFASYEALGISQNTSKGFQRPLYLFTKSVSGECYDALGMDIFENRKAKTTSYYD